MGISLVLSVTKEDPMSCCMSLQIVDFRIDTPCDIAAAVSTWTVSLPGYLGTLEWLLVPVACYFLAPCVPMALTVHRNFSSAGLTGHLNSKFAWIPRILAKGSGRMEVSDAKV